MMNRKMMRCVVIVLTLLGCVVGSAQTQRTAHVEGWEFMAAPYLWMAGLDGDVSIGATAASGEADFGDIWDNLETGFQGYLEMRNESLGFYLDTTLIEVSSDATVAGAPINVSVETSMVELGVLKRVYEGHAGTEGLNVGTDVFIGGRYVNLEGGIDLAGGTVSGDQDWIDPIFGLIYHRDMSEKFVISTSGDFGGLGIGSDMTWSFRIMGSYRIADHANLLFGYRYLDIDYDDGAGASKFKYDVAMSGPIIGASINF
jgi:hypothetical protein